jgi:hypothetical protein
MFASGAVFTGVDIGIDISLINNYANDTVMADFFIRITACWIFLGGLVQTFVIIYLLRKQDPLVSNLPMPVGILVFCTAPVLMAPVIVNVYGAYLIIKKKPENPRNDAEIVNTRKLISALKAAETAFETLPQLCTQWGIILFMVLDSKNRSSAGLLPLQTLSITTSTITLVLSTVYRISLTRPKQFISAHYPVSASLAPLCLFLLSGVATGTTQIRYLGGIVMVSDSLTAISISYFVLNLVAMVFDIFILNVTCHNLAWRICRTAVRNFPCQTLKIRKVSVVVMGS